MLESLWALFISAFISSTLLPGGAEALLAYQVSQTPDSIYILVAVATLGNTLGSCITLAMGLFIARVYPLRVLDKPSHQRAKRWLRQSGPWMLLLAWLPIIGDPLCLLAGWLRLDLIHSFAAILIGKLLRFLVVALLALGLFG
jgi:membrane protein YqaA with SNARE-associated domain